jgi:hypothetical protein
MFKLIRIIFYYQIKKIHLFIFWKYNENYIFQAIILEIYLIVFLNMCFKTGKATMKAMD